MRLSYAFAVRVRQHVSPSLPGHHKEIAFLILNSLCGYADGPELVISYFSVISQWKSLVAELHDLQTTMFAGKTSFLLVGVFCG